MDAFSELKWRGLVQDCTGEKELSKLLSAGPVTLYCGFDPTADSLHVGNMVPLLTMARLQRHGHRPIALAGGATGLVGDPSGKSKERNLLDAETLARNVRGIKGQLTRFLDFEGSENNALLVDNADWIAPISFLDWLRDVGKFFSVNVMMGKESVRSRLQTGISYTEFSYMLLQAYDFLHLYRTEQCQLQIGGADQWGNITAGTDLIRKNLQASAHGLTVPLITDTNGKKLGKTAEGAIWLDPTRTSPFDFYQYFVRTSDADVLHLIKVLTFLEPGEVDELAREVETRPDQRIAQKRLAHEFTSLIHGESEARAAAEKTQRLYTGGADVADLAALAIHVEAPLGEEGTDIVPLLLAAKLLPSKGQAKRMVDQGGVYVNEERITSDNRRITAERLKDGYLQVRVGKKKRGILAFPVE